MLKTTVLLVVAITCSTSMPMDVVKSRIQASDTLGHCAGYVNDDGTIRESHPSGCFEVTRFSEGVYQVIFRPELPDRPVCTVTARRGNPTSPGNTTTNALVTDIDSSKFYYATGKSGQLRDIDVLFICVYE